MPKRVLDFDALWASDKIASCPAWAQAEYAWLYGLADASGSFELTNLRVIWGRVAAIRKDLTLERLEDAFQEFMARGLLFTWEAGGKRYGHWTGSDVPGRLPPPSWRARLERLAPPLPKEKLAAYTAKFSSRREAEVSSNEATLPPDEMPEKEDVLGSAEQIPADAIESNSAQLKLGLEAAQGQEWDWDKNWKKEREERNTPPCAPPSHSPDGEITRTHRKSSGGDAGTVRPDDLLDAYERERGSLPAAADLTPERRRECGRRIRAGLSVETFAAAVRRAAVTPFLAGAGARGWRASFDWLIANDTNVRKVIEGVYDSAATGSPAQQRFGGRSADRALYSEIHAGAGPIAAQSGARAKPEAIERMRAREAARRPP